MTPKLQELCDDRYLTGNHMVAVNVRIASDAVCLKIVAGKCWAGKPLHALGAV